MSEMTSPPARWAVHTRYSDPGPYLDLLSAVLPTIPELSAAARNLIVHYRASGLELPEETRADVNARWLSAILALDQERHGLPLSAERDPLRRVQGCCRDHSLFAVAVLRQHGVPARMRYGFAHYFVPDYRVDHVIVETWLPDEQRWSRFDPEVESPTERLATPQDMPHGPDAPFVTSAEAWQACRAGTVDPSSYGVGPGTGIGGEWFMQCAVCIDAAFRAGIELLLWDGWAAMSSPDGVTDVEGGLADELSELIVAADAGNSDAEQRLIDRVRHDPGVGPGDVVRTMSPFGDPPVTTDLRT